MSSGHSDFEYVMFSSASRNTPAPGASPMLGVDSRFGQGATPFVLDSAVQKFVAGQDAFRGRSVELSVLNLCIRRQRTQRRKVFSKCWNVLFCEPKTWRVACQFYARDDLTRRCFQFSILRKYKSSGREKHLVARVYVTLQLSSIWTTVRVLVYKLVWMRTMREVSRQWNVQLLWAICDQDIQFHAALYDIFHFGNKNAVAPMVLLLLRPVEKLEPLPALCAGSFARENWLLGW